MAALLCAAFALAAPLRGAYPDGSVGRSAAQRVFDGILERAAQAEKAERWASAATSYLDAVRMAEAAGWTAEEIAALTGRFRCLERLYDYLGARPVLVRLLALQQGTEQASGRRRATTWLAGVESELGHDDEAIRLAEAVASDPGSDARTKAAALETLGLARLRRSDFALALRATEGAVSAWREAGAAAEAEACDGNLAGIYVEVGDFEAALSIYREILGRVHGDSLERADALGNLGLALYGGLDDVEGGIEALTEAKAVYERLGERESEGLAWLHLAAAQRYRGSLDAADESVREARKRIAPEGPNAPYADVGEADVLLERPRPDVEKARALFERVLAASVALGRLEQEIEARSGLVCVALAGGDAQGALAEARRAMDAMDVLGAGLPVEQVGLVRAMRSTLYEVGIQAAVASGDPAAIAEMLERGRAVALVEALGGRGALLGVGLDGPLAKREGEARAALAAAEGGFKAAIEEGDRVKSMAAAAALEKARREFLAAEDAIQRDARLAVGVSHPHHASLPEIQGSLAKGDVLVLYALQKDPHLASADLAGALVVEAQGKPRWVSLGDPGAILAACEAADLSAIEETDAAWKAVRALADLVVRPLGIPKTTRRLLVSPDGGLAVAPLPLCLRTGTQAPDADVAFVPSGTVYRMLLAERARAGKGVLAVADPVYDAPAPTKAGQVYGRGRRLPRLEETRREVEPFQRDGDVRLLGPDATEARFREAAARHGRWSAVHLACHGLLDAARPMLSSLALTASGDDDGYLTTAEVSRMRLPADLVVLSACDVGRGKVVRAEGTYGLPRAFMCAGAPRVIAGLWAADDVAAATLMLRFHREWAIPGVTTAQSLRRAQDAVAADRRWAHPKHWAGWVIWGLPD